ncbi:unnamed protein product [Amaranthus hypochondriacus]
METFVATTWICLVIMMMISMGVVSSPNQKYKTIQYDLNTVDCRSNTFQIYGDVNSFSCWNKTSIRRTLCIPEQLEYYSQKNSCHCAKM